MKQLVTYLFIVLLSLASHTHYAQSSYDAYQTLTDPTIDGVASESCWQTVAWKSIDQLWIGTSPSSSDFQGKYKICWNGSKLFILVEVVDDVLYDGHSSPLTQWYDDDCVEIFVDEDRSKGNHQCTYNAFAYHVAINGDVVDLGTDCNPHLYNAHVSSAHTVSGTTYTWELAMTVYGSSYSDVSSNTPVTLYNGKTSGFSLAYCDDDGSNTRESFMGSEVMPSGHNNDNYITADYFGTLNLKGPGTSLSIQEPVIYPTDGFIHVRNSENKICQLSIVDCSGRCVLTEDFQLEQKDIEHSLPSGFYIVRIQTENNVIARKLYIR